MTDKTFPIRKYDEMAYSMRCVKRYNSNRETGLIMPVRIVADIVVLIHFLWILFLIFGAFWGRRQKTIKVIHIGGLAFALLLQVFDWYCPLTHLEVWLRAMHDPGRAYAGSYLAHYLEKIIYMEVHRWVIVALTMLLCLFNAWIYSRQRKIHRSR